jgi:hypothetical protein
MQESVHDRSGHPSDGGGRSYGQAPPVPQPSPARGAVVTLVVARHRWQGSSTCRTRQQLYNTQSEQRCRARRYGHQSASLIANGGTLPYHSGSQTEQSTNLPPPQ